MIHVISVFVRLLLGRNMLLFVFCDVVFIVMNRFDVLKFFVVVFNALQLS